MPEYILLDCLTAAILGLVNLFAGLNPKIAQCIACWSVCRCAMELIDAAGWQPRAAQLRRGLLQSHSRGASGRAQSRTARLEWLQLLQVSPSLLLPARGGSVLWRRQRRMHHQQRHRMTRLRQKGRPAAEAPSAGLLRTWQSQRSRQHQRLGMSGAEGRGLQRSRMHRMLVRNHRKRQQQDHRTSGQPSAAGGALSHLRRGSLSRPSCPSGRGHQRPHRSPVVRVVPLPCWRRVFVYHLCGRQ